MLFVIFACQEFRFSGKLMKEVLSGIVRKSSFEAEKRKNKDQRDGRVFSEKIKQVPEREER